MPNILVDLRYYRNIGLQPTIWAGNNIYEWW